MGYRGIDVLLPPEGGVRQVLSFSQGCCLYGLDRAEVTVRQMDAGPNGPLMRADIDFGDPDAALEYVRCVADAFGEDFTIHSGGVKTTASDFPWADVTRYVTILRT